MPLTRYIAFGKSLFLSGPHWKNDGIKPVIFMSVPALGYSRDYSENKGSKFKSRKHGETSIKL